MHANDEARHSMITAVTARLTPDCVAAHLHTAQVMTSVQAHWVGPNVNEAPGAHRPYKFSNNMDGWTKIVTNVLDRFKSEFGAVLVRIPMQKLAWKPAVMDLDAHIANFQIHLHYLTILQSPLATDDQIVHFIRSLNKRDLATRVKFNMAMNDAIRPVPDLPANHLYPDNN